MKPETKIRVWVETCVKNAIDLNLSAEEIISACRHLGYEMGRYAEYKHIISKSADAMLAEFTGVKNGTAVDEQGKNRGSDL